MDEVTLTAFRRVIQATGVLTEAVIPHATKDPDLATARDEVVSALSGLMEVLMDCKGENYGRRA